MDGQSQQQQFDLSAGLVPSTPPPASATPPKKPTKKTYDLSAGLISSAPATITVDPTQFRTPDPAALLNPSKEGQYSLTKDNTSVLVPYSQIASSLRSGYQFSSPGERERFGKDYDYGAKGSYEDHEVIARALNRQPESRLAYATRATGQDIRRTTEGTPVAGAVKEARQTVGGVLDLTAKWLRSRTMSENGQFIADFTRSYQKAHPGATEDDARAALAPLLSPAEHIQKVADAVNSGTELHGLGEEAGGLGELIAELLLPETLVGRFAEGTRVARAANLLDVSDISNPLLRTTARAAAEGTKAAAEQGGQQFVHTGGDIQATEEAALGGGVMGGVASVVPDILVGSNQFLKNSTRHRFGVDERTTEQIIQEVGKDNAKIDEDLVEAQRKFKQDLRNYGREQRSVGATAPYAEDNEVKVGPRIAAENARLNRDAVTVKRQNLTDAIARTRTTIQERLQAIHDSARVYFRKAYGDLQEEAGGGGVDYGTLADGVHSALEEVKGSAESTRAFKDILARAGRLAQEQEPEQAVLERLAEMDPDERAAEMDRMREDREPTDASLGELNGYYSELGRVVDSPSTPGDVKAAAQKFRSFIDREIKEELGPELYAKNKAIRGQYRKFAQGFLDYSGPSGSGSPVAAALQAKDAYNATRPLVGKPDEVDARIRDILVGKARDPDNLFTPGKIAERYERQAAEEGEQPQLAGQGKQTSAALFRRQTLGMIRNLDNMEEGLDALPTSEKLDQEVARADEALAKARTEARAAAHPTTPGEPQYTVLSPDELERRKAAIYSQQIHNLGKFGTWVAIGGLVGGISGLLGGRDPRGALREAAAGAAIGVLAPYAAYRLLSMPDVVESLTHVTRKDLTLLAALPPAQRAGVEQGIRELSDAAVQSGKLKADAIPWLRVIGGEVGKGVTGAKTPTPTPTGQLALPPTPPQMMPLAGAGGAPQ